MTHAIVEEALLSHTGNLHVAQAVEDKEHSAVLKDARVIVGSRCGCRYVVLGVCDSASIQFNTPFSTSTAADFE